MSVLILATLLGVVAGLRTMTAPAALAIAAWLGRPDLSGGWAFFLGHPASAAVFLVLALGEYAADKLPSTPSRKVPLQLAARLASGGFCGAVLATPSGLALAGGCAGLAGALLGTLAGAWARSAMAARLGRDRPAALMEDTLAVLCAAGIMAAL